MDPHPSSWTLPVPRVARSLDGESAVAAALGRCRPLFRRSVLVVGGDGVGWEALRLAKAEGAWVTALCPAGHATQARAAGADVVLDPVRTDPTWYRGAWSVIVDPAGGIGFRRAIPSLSADGAYVTGSARPADRVRALLGRVSGGPRLLRLPG